MPYRPLPAWRGAYLPPGKGPTAYAPLPRPFTMRAPKGLGDQLTPPANVPSGTTMVNLPDASGNILGYTPSGSLGPTGDNCSSWLTWLNNYGCWNLSPSGWSQAAQAFTNTQNAIASAVPGVVDTSSLDTTTPALAAVSASQAIQASLDAATAQGQADVLAGVQSAYATPSMFGTCDSTSDPLGCVNGWPWWVWAVIAGGGLFMLMAVKK